jgi:hypothetical protein
VPGVLVDGQESVEIRGLVAGQQLLEVEVELEAGSRSPVLTGRPTTPKRLWPYHGSRP